MPRLEMGSGFKALVAFIFITVIFSTGGILGGLYVKGAQKDSNIQVLSIDSKVSQEINVETEQKKGQLDGKITKLKSPIINNDGYVSPEFMQLIQSTKSDAERRGNQTGFVYELTRP